MTTIAQHLYAENGPIGGVNALIGLYRSRPRPVQTQAERDAIAEHIAKHGVTRARTGQTGMEDMNTHTGETSGAHRQRMNRAKLKKRMWADGVL